MRLKALLGAAVAIALCELAGLIGAIFTSPAALNWYASLNHPILTPPAWLFGPVWTALYALMGIAAYLVWRAEGRGALRFAALWLFALQLAANVLWSVLFFGAQSPSLALLDLGILWLLVAATLVAFARINRPAAWLLAPYLAWVTFAAYLNLSIVLLN